MSTEALHNQVAIITGGLGDIGRAVARELAARGAVVALCDVSEASAAAALLQELGRPGRAHSAMYDRVDVTDAAAVDRWVESVEQKLGTPTLAIANAATVTMSGLLEMTAEQWRRELDVNLNGAFHTAMASVRAMTRAGRAGRIVFVGSWAAEVPHPHVPAYSVAKAGLRMLCKCLALELAPKGILVNEIAPGFVDAGLSAQVFRQSPGMRDAAAHRVPTGRLISSEDVAQQVAYLCGASGDHITGAVLLMDGGLSLGEFRRTEGGR